MLFWIILLRMFVEQITLEKRDVSLKSREAGLFIVQYIKDNIGQRSSRFVYSLVLKRNSSSPSLGPQP